MSGNIRHTLGAAVVAVVITSAGAAQARGGQILTATASLDTRASHPASTDSFVSRSTPDYEAWFWDLHDIHDEPNADPEGLGEQPTGLVLRESGGGTRAGAHQEIDDKAWGGPTFSIEVFEHNIRDALYGNVIGYAYAINYQKQLYSADSAGEARNSADGFELQSPYKVMNIASVSKLLTTIGVLQLLEMNGMSINDPIWPWLPDDWTLGPGVQGVTFKHLLTHQTGWANVPSNSWDGLKAMVEAGASPTNANLNDGNADPGYLYKNANFGLFRMIVPALWDASPEAPGIDTVADWSSSVWYAVYMQDHVFEPLDIDHALCVNVEEDPVLYYDVNANTEPGIGGGNWIDSCMFGGWYLSAYDLAKIMAHLRYTENLLSAENRALMDDLYLGWNAPDKWSDWVKGLHGTYLTHGGDIGFDAAGADLQREVQACVMQFPIEVEVALLINSSHTLGDYQCTVIKNAFDEAWVN